MPTPVLCFHLVHANSIRDIRHVQIGILVLLLIKVEAQMSVYVNPLNGELNPICHLLALLGGATIVVVSRLRVKGEVGVECLDCIQKLYCNTCTSL